MVKSFNVLLQRTVQLDERLVQPVETSAQRIEPLFHRLAKCAKALVRRSANDLQALVHGLIKSIRALVQLTLQAVERLVQYVEPMAQPIEPLVNCLTERVKFPIDAVKPRVRDPHSFGGCLGGRFIPTDPGAEDIV